MCPTLLKVKGSLVINFIKSLASFIYKGTIALALGLFFILVTIQVLAALQWVGKI